MKNTVLFVCLTCLVGFFVPGAGAQISDPPTWDWDISVEMRCGNEEPAYLFNIPDGSGSPLSHAQRADGSYIDCTVEVTIVNWDGVPLANFPAEDMWLESADGGMVPCTSGYIADSNTNDLGFTLFTGPFYAGGSNEAVMSLMLSGIAMGDQLPLFNNSADLNGDGVVNLIDVGIFSESFYGEYSHAADFFHDGALNLADVGRLASGSGAQCP